MNVRAWIWRQVKRYVPEGQILPIWARIVLVILAPLDTLFSVLSRTRGYQWERDVWIIEGVEYSAEGLRQLSRSNGETYRITRKGGTVLLERMK